MDQVNILYKEDEIFKEIDKLNLFSPLTNKFADFKTHKCKSSSPNVNDFEILTKLLYNKMVKLQFNVAPFESENVFLETWDTVANITKNKQCSSNLEWHEDDFGALSYPVYSCVVYYYRGKYLDGGNLLIRNGLCQQVSTIDTWSSKTIVMFKGNTHHCPQDIALIDRPPGVVTLVKDITRRVVSFFVRSLE